jgi:hypothetical protein
MTPASRPLQRLKLGLGMDIGAERVPRLPWASQVEPAYDIDGLQSQIFLSLGCRRLHQLT